MKNSLKKRVLSMAMAVSMVFSGMPTDWLSAMAEPVNASTVASPTDE